MFFLSVVIFIISILLNPTAIFKNILPYNYHIQKADLNTDFVLDNLIGASQLNKEKLNICPITQLNGSEKDNEYLYLILSIILIKLAHNKVI
ncbi:hypothetical protein [Rickettsia endosymbiont of Cardiosporidium cionae]|uniref:hypothetical protein n=1 Tax=Rickettsia endosymbiont of Cardiosporidium cionae TaxID=2777155 RepID=UPI0018945563|nr:hypothetical protein [Rickettsia endosymbiont of Cardiosporidium cionae]KAF8818972.1 hypothetical protein IHI24_000207 [Rickettsia endosymbiont of Cardiosporidium cionae]